MKTARPRPKHRPTEMLKTPLMVLFLIGVASTAVSAQETNPAPSWHSGSRAQRPVVKEPALGSTPTSAHLENASPLAAAQLATIQGVGQNVLAAKHSVKPDPSVEAMRQQMKAVSTELDQALRDSAIAKPGTTSATNTQTNGLTVLNAEFTSVTPREFHLVPGAAPNTFVAEPAAPSASQIKPAFATAVPPTAAAAKNNDAWHNDTVSLRSRLTDARAQIPVAVDAPGAKASVRGHLANKQTQLLDDVQRAIDAKDLTQLAALRDRLTPRQLPEERKHLQALADPKHKMPSAAPTPTVSTLTQHRGSAGANHAH